MRKLAYRRYSEARAAHWLILLAADRVDAIESHLSSLFTKRPVNPFLETGLSSEVTHHGLSSRLGKKRVDVVHHPLDPIVVAAPPVAMSVLLFRLIRAVTRHRRGRR
jgi:hypothetical protein